jgi:PAS domain S-box-containing protein
MEIAISQLKVISDRRDIEMKTFPRWLIVTFASAFLAVLASGAWFYRVQKQHLRQRIEENLQTIAKSKAMQIAWWRAERLADAALLMKTPFFFEGVERWMANPLTEDAGKILACFRSLQDDYHYYGITLVDAHGQVRLSLHDDRGPLHEEALKALTIAWRDRCAVLADLHKGPGTLPPRVSAIAPLFMGKGETSKPIGAIILENDASQFLYPLIQSWPTPTRSAETLLVRRDGDDVLFLNELRHRQDTALKLRIPLSRTDIPAVMAVLGKEGTVPGKDYRGVKVLSALTAIPDSPWFIVAKMDQAEAFAAWHFHSILILALIVVLMAVAAAIMGVIWQGNRKAHYQTLFKVEMALRKSEERYRATLISVGDAVMTTDTEGRVELLNPVAEALTGWRHEEARDQPIEKVFCIVNEETRQAVENPVHRVVREGSVVGLANHTVLIAKDGVERLIADSGAPIRDETGAVSGVVLVFRDQTQERAAQRALQVERDNLQSIFASSPVGMMVLDEEEQIINVNPAAERLFNKKLSELEHKKCGDLIACSNRYEYPQGCGYSSRCPTCPLFSGIREVFSNGRGIHDRESSVESGEASGRYWLQFSIEPIIFNERRHVVVAVNDITERKKAEAMLRESEEKFRAIVENTSDYIMRYDRHGRHSYGNPSTLAVSGFTLKEFIGKTHRELGFPEPLCRLWEDAIEEVLTSGKPRTLPFEVQLAKGLMFLELKLCPEFASDGAVHSVIGISRDITERVRAEEELRALTRQMEHILETTKTGLDIIDHEYNLHYVDPGWAKLYGDWRGKKCYEYFMGRNNSCPKCEISKAFATKEKIVTEEILVKEGNRPIQVTTIPFQDERGEWLVAEVNVDITERKRAEEARRQSERLLAEVIQFLPDATLAIDKDKRVTIWNHAMERLTGIPAKDMLGKGDYAYTVPFYGQARPQLMDLFWESDHVIKTKYPLLKKDGDTLTIEVFCPSLYNGKGAHVWAKATPLHNSTGELTGAIECIRDVSDRKKAEEAILESQRKLKDIVDFLPDATLVVDKEGQVIAWNRAIEVMTGVKAEEMLGKGNYEYALPFYGERRPILIDLALHADEGIETRYTTIYRVEDILFGEAFTPMLPSGNLYLSATACVLRDAKGNIVGAIECIRDITERKRVEEMLREREEFLSSIVENIPDMIFIKDTRDLRFIRVNKAGEMLLGYKREDLSGQNDHDFFPKEQADFFTKKDREVLERGELYDIPEEPIETKTGRRILHTKKIPILDRNGKPAYLLGISEDITERKRAEEALRESEAKYRQLFEAESDAIFLIDNETGQIYEANSAASNTYGYTHEELLALRNTDLSVEPDKTRQATQDQANVIPLRWHRKKDGTVFPVEISASHLSWNERFVHIAAIRDITERKRTEDVLRESEARLRAVLDATPFPIALVDVQDDKIVYWSRSAFTLFGHTAPTAAEWYQIAYPDPDYQREVINRWKPFLEKARSSGHTVNTGEYQITCRNGSVHICELYATFLRDILIVTFNDITERKKAEESLRQSEEKFRSIVDNIGIGVALISPDMEILSLNKQMKKWNPHIDLKDKHICYRAFNNPPREEICSYCPTAKTLKDGVVHEDVTETPMGGQVINYRIISSPIKDETGTVIAAIEIVEDITERKQMEDALRASLEEKEALLREVHHRVKNNLQIVASLLNLQAGRSPDPELAAALNDTRNRVHSMALLHEALYSAGNLARVNFAAYVEDLCRQLLRSFGPMAARITMKSSVAPIGLPLEQSVPCGLIINELVSNALKHGFPGDRAGCISVELRPAEGQTLVLSIRDDGVGLPPGFNPASSTTLGLRLVSTLAKQLGGQLTVKSPDGAGATFNVVFSVPMEAIFKGEV